MPVGGGKASDPSAVYDALELPEGANGRPYVFLNMVTTLDGKVALGGSAGGIGSRIDRALMRPIRAAADAIMIGAATLRAEICDPRVDLRYAMRRAHQGRPPQPLAVTVSGALDLEPTNRFLVNGRDRTIVLTTESVPGERRQRLAPYATLVIQDRPRVDLADSLGYLYERHGVRRLLCEGGPSLNQQLLDAGLIEEVFCTIAPKLAGGRGRALVDGDHPAERISARMELVSLYEHQGELYARYRLRRGHHGGYET